MSIGKATFVGMQTAVEKTHHIADHFVPDRATPYQLMIDATGGEAPLLALFDLQMNLKFVGSSSQYATAFPVQPLGELQLRRVQCVIPAIDLILFPEEVYDERQEDIYGSYLLDDGVTTISQRPFSNLGIRALYREVLDGLTPFWQQFPRMETVPLPALLVDGIASAWDHPVFGIHRMDREAVFYLIQHGQLRYCHTRSYDNEDGFNYSLIEALAEIGDERSAFNVLLSGHFRFGDSYFRRVVKYLELDRVRIADPAELTSISLTDVPEELRQRLLPSCLLLVSTDSCEL